MSRLGLAILGVLILTSVTRADEFVHLVGFDSQASTLNNRATGRTSFRLTAGAAWSKSAPRGRSTYTVKIGLPDGRTLNQPLHENEGPGSARLTIDVPAESVRNLIPDEVVVQIQVVDTANGMASNILTARISEFPGPISDGPRLDVGPFGGGKPLDGPAGEARIIPKAGPDGLTFVRIPTLPTRPGYLIATRETTNAQLRARQPDYNPLKGRSDEFALEGPDQPALNLTPEQTETYLHELSRSGLGFRLPTVAEWTLAANAGRASHYWWGDMAAFPDGANLLGPEPGLTSDTTAPPSGFQPNPWSLFHTYGNIEEWAKEADGSYHRLGGHFRTEPSETPPAFKVAGPNELGPDPYVGVRVALDLTSEVGATILLKQLASVVGLRSPQASFDPDRGLATIGGQCDDASIRRAADQVVGRLWFVAAIDNRIASPTPPPRGLALIGKVEGPAKTTRPLGRQVDLIPLDVQWANPLPVAGSDWFANIYLSGGRHFAHRLFAGEPGPSRRVTIALDLANLTSSEPFRVALSLGKPAPRPDDTNIVSNLATIDWPPKQAPTRP